MFAWLSNPEAWIALFTLIAVEVVLGIDNIVFITILANRLPEAERPKARTFGLLAAMLTRIVLLLSITWIARLTHPLFAIGAIAISGRDLILVVGGMFLIGKSTLEIHHQLEGEASEVGGARKTTFLGVIIQIALLDLVFSLDSVITAVGLADDISVMVIAIMVAVLVMLFAAKTVGDFVEKHPTIKMLALSFLLLIGFTLITESLQIHVPKGYIYFAMAFSLGVEMLNMRVRGRASAIALRKKFQEDSV